MLIVTIDEIRWASAVKLSAHILDIQSFWKKKTVSFQRTINCWWPYSQFNFIIYTMKKYNFNLQTIKYYWIILATFWSVLFFALIKNAVNFFIMKIDNSKVFKIFGFENILIEDRVSSVETVSYTHLTLPTIYSV